MRQDRRGWERREKEEAESAVKWIWIREVKDDEIARERKKKRIDEERKRMGSRKL